MHDYRFVLALVAYEPALAELFDEGQREAGRKLNGMGNAIVHFEPLRQGAVMEAEDLAQRLERRVAPGGAPAGEMLDELFHDIQRLAGEGRHEEVLRLAERWIGLQRENPNAWSWKAPALYYLGRHTEALECSGVWVALQPDNSNAWSWKAECLDSLGRYEEARFARKHESKEDPGAAAG